MAKFPREFINIHTHTHLYIIYIYESNQIPKNTIETNRKQMNIQSKSNQEQMKNLYLEITITLMKTLFFIFLLLTAYRVYLILY